MNRHCLLIAAVALAVSVGCSGDSLSTVPATGIVTLDGNPVAGAGVMFIPVQEGPPASAVTDAEGKFTLETAGQPGAVPGQHRVTVTLQKTTGVTVNEEGLEAGPAGQGQIKIEWVVPEKYSRPDTSELTAEVKSGGGPIELVLKSK